MQKPLDELRRFCYYYYIDNALYIIEEDKVTDFKMVPEINDGIRVVKETATSWYRIGQEYYVYLIDGDKVITNKINGKHFRCVIPFDHIEVISKAGF